jgi:hypothetical protein
MNCNGIFTKILKTLTSLDHD